MTDSDLAIIEADRSDRWLAGLIQALVKAEIESQADAARGTYDDEMNTPEGIQGEMK